MGPFPKPPLRAGHQGLRRRGTSLPRYLGGWHQRGRWGSSRKILACHLTNHLCICAESSKIPTKMFHAFSKPQKPGFLRVGDVTGCKRTLPSSQIAFVLVHFCVIHHKANPHSFQRVMGAQSPVQKKKKSPRGLPLDWDIYIRGCLTNTVGFCPWAPLHLGARKRASKAHLEPLTASPRFPGPLSPLFSTREISQVAEAGGPGLGSCLRPLATNKPRPPPPKTHSAVIPQSPSFHTCK